MDGFKPETMIIAHPEGTWLLRRGEEPVLLGSEADFERIWMTELGITSASIEKFTHR